MSFIDLDASDKATGQKGLSPEGFANNGPATSLLLSHRSMADMLLRRASSAGHSWRNSNIHSFSTGCQAHLTTAAARPPSMRLRFVS
jgi:hypothetical protein